MSDSAKETYLCLKQIIQREERVVEGTSTRLLHIITPGQSGTMLVRDIYYSGDIIVFEGMLQDGRKAVVCQHYSQVSYTIAHSQLKTGEAVEATSTESTSEHRTIGFKSG